MKEKMSKLNFKIILLFIVFILFPINTLALSNEYISINETKHLEFDDVMITYLSFNDYSTTSTQAFGLSGTIANLTDEQLNYTITVYYYDANYNLITDQEFSNTLIAGAYNSLNLMSNLSVLDTHSVSEIAYYSLYITTDTNYMNSAYTPSQLGTYNSYDYVIDAYDINVVVNENNTLDITETITAYFNVAKHGIYRSIPLKNKVTRLDGTTSVIKAQISNVSVDKQYSTSKVNNTYKIKIGSSSNTITGSQTYVIKYTYNLGKDKMKDYDELYYNLIGNEWDTVIGNVTFSITMPKDFDSSKLGFSSGLSGSTDSSKIKYSVSGNTITGSYQGILDVNEGLTVRCELDEGYFVNAKLEVSTSVYLLFILPISFLIISALLVYIFGRDETVVETVEFYPPEGFNSLEIGYLYKGEANSKDVVSLLIYLASKGYIKIVDNTNKIDEKELNINVDNKIMDLQKKLDYEKKNNPSSEKIKYYENMLNVYKDINKPIDYDSYGLSSTIKVLNKKNDFTLIKLKDYDGNNLNELMFFKGLFTERPEPVYSLWESLVGKKRKSSNKELSVVTLSDLYNNFYITLDRILKNINNKQNKNKIFKKSSTNKIILIVLMILATYFIITIIPLLDDGGFLVVTIMFPGMIFLVMLINMLGTTGVMPLGDENNKFAYILLGILGSIIWLLLMCSSWGQDYLYLLGDLVGIICIILMVLCLKYLPKRTEYGNELFGKIKGFRNFLITVKKEKLEELVTENPTYFYDILPYTYVLGVSDKWIKKFETISLQEPDWYDCPSGFNMDSFDSFMDNTMSSVQSSMSSGSSSDSGGSSGGGSSGGGSGGGGGGSW